MTKKFKARKELEEAVASKPNAEDCPDTSCRQHFYGSPLARESHQKLYPSHFGGKTKVTEKEEAAPVDLEPKVYRRKQK